MNTLGADGKHPSLFPKHYGGKRGFKDGKIGILDLQVPEPELEHSFETSLFLLHQVDPTS